MKVRSSSYHGLSIVEIIVAAAIIVTLVTAAAGAWQLYLRVSGSSTNQSQAALIIEEGSEALRALRDHSWSDLIDPLALNTEYQINWTGSSYQITSADILIQNKFIRTFRLSEIYRDTNDDITSSGGTLDEDSRMVLMSVFMQGATSTPIMQAEMLIHNVYAN